MDLSGFWAFISAPPPPPCPWTSIYIHIDIRIYSLYKYVIIFHMATFSPLPRHCTFLIAMWGKQREPSFALSAKEVKRACTMSAQGDLWHRQIGLIVYRICRGDRSIHLGMDYTFRWILLSYMCDNHSTYLSQHVSCTWPIHNIPQHARSDLSGILIVNVVLHSQQDNLFRAALTVRYWGWPAGG